MIAKYVSRTAILAGLIGAAALMYGNAALAAPAGSGWTPMNRQFDNTNGIDFESPVPGVGHISEVCSGTFPDASAEIKVNQPLNGPHFGTTVVEIRVFGAVPETLFTVWNIFDLTFGAPPPAGFTFSPLTTDPVTPLVDPRKIIGLVGSTPSEALDSEDARENLGILNGLGLGTDFDRFAENSLEEFPNPSWGDPFPANGFWTDENGDGEYKVELPFGVFRDSDGDNGYPFDLIRDELEFRFGELDESEKQLDTLPINDAAIVQAKIAMVSHCYDGVGHGLVSGTDERWFNIAVDPRN